MLVAARDHQDFVALQSMVAGEDIGGEVAACDLSEVYRPIGVGPRDSY